MTEQEFKTVYPLIADWIQKTLAEHVSTARPVASLGFGFKRLPHYDDEKTLVSTKVVVVSKVPMPPPVAHRGEALVSAARVQLAPSQS